MYWAYLYNGVCKIAKSFRNRKMRQGVEFATADAEFKLRLLKIKLSKYIDLEYIYTKPLYRSLLFFYDIINIVIGHSVCYLVQFYKTSKNWKNLSLLFLKKKCWCLILERIEKMIFDHYYHHKVLIFGPHIFRESPKNWNEFQILWFSQNKWN